MGVLAFRILVAIAVCYLTVLAILFALQGRFIYPAPQESQDPAPGFEAVKLLTPDGLDLVAHWREPELGQPVAVWFHGNGGSLAGATIETQAIARAGYGVLLASYRGYGGNPGEPSEQGLYDDGRTAMAFLAEQGFSPDQIIIGGNSLGSGVAVQMAKENSPAALILVSPFTSLTDAAADALPMFPVRPLLKDTYDNAGKLDGMQLPLLIQHGTADNVVPFAHGKALSERVEGSAFQVFEGAGHDLTFTADAQDAQVQWLRGQGFGAEGASTPSR